MQSSFLKDKLRRLHSVKPGRRAPDNPEVDGDTSYEDALLDLQLRNYFRTEYGMAEPPTGVFPRLLAAIRVHRRAGAEAPNARPAAGLLLSLSRLQQVLRTSTAHRLVSGAVAAAIMLAIVSSTSMSNLHPNLSSQVTEDGTPVAVAPLDNEEARERDIERDNRYVINVNPPSISSDPAFYDPVELRIPPRTEAASGSTTPSRWQRFGGQ